MKLTDTQQEVIDLLVRGAIIMRVSKRKGYRVQHVTCFEDLPRIGMLVQKRTAAALSKLKLISIKGDTLELRPVPIEVIK